MVVFPDSVSINEISSVLHMQEMKIEILLKFPDNQKVDTIALIDCRAKGSNFIDEVFAYDNNLPRKKLPHGIPILNADGSENIGGKIQEYVYALVEVQGRSRRYPLLITALGTKWLYWDIRG
jgi:hypothetical protein